MSSLLLAMFFDLPFKLSSRFFFSIIVLSTTVSAQLSNDNVSQRSQLIVDEHYTSSSTREATVEWNCINKSLTNKCLLYHNDQWFSFSVPRSGRYYLNISSQICKDNNGIQAIVIEGNPCQISTYKILHCIPRIRQQDVYIELDSLKTNASYLVNIDGFLGDYCEFDIGLSSHASGFSHIAENLDILNLSVQTENGIATLTWELPDGLTDEVQGFEVQRYASPEKKPSSVNSLPLDLNSLGIAQKQYSFTDTLPSTNSFTYEIIGLFKDGRKVVLDKEAINLNYTMRSANQPKLNFSLHYKDGVELQILLIDRSNGRVLRQSSFQYNKVLDTSRSTFVGNYVEAGVSNFMVRIINLKSHQTTDLTFFVSPEGVVVKK